MKRSEMVDFIHEMVEGSLEEKEWPREHADSLLSLLESKGLLPPTRTEKSVIPGISDFQVNKWEPEDEPQNS